MTRANSIFHDPNINLYRINRKLQSIGWSDIKIDYHTFVIAETILNQSSRVSQTNSRYIPIRDRIVNSFYRNYRNTRYTYTL